MAASASSPSTVPMTLHTIAGAAAYNGISLGGINITESTAAHSLGFAIISWMGTSPEVHVRRCRQRDTGQCPAGRPAVHHLSAEQRPVIRADVSRLYLARPCRPGLQVRMGHYRPAPAARRYLVATRQGSAKALYAAIFPGNTTGPGLIGQQQTSHSIPQKPAPVDGRGRIMRNRTLPRSPLPDARPGRYPPSRPRLRVRHRRIPVLTWGGAWAILRSRLGHAPY